MNTEEFYSKIRISFPDLARAADIEFERRNGLLDLEMKYLWFESLSESINNSMHKSISSDMYIELFECIRHSYHKGDEGLKNIIDVAFVENLFWSVPIEKAKTYWVVLPEVLKGLYVSFHGKSPA